MLLVARISSGVKNKLLLRLPSPGGGARYLTWLEGTLRSESKRGRANNSRLGAASCLSRTAPAPLSRRATRDKEQGRIRFQRRQVTLLFHSSTFKKHPQTVARNSEAVYADRVEL